MVGPSGTPPPPPRLRAELQVHFDAAGDMAKECIGKGGGVLPSGPGRGMSMGLQEI